MSSSPAIVATLSAQVERVAAFKAWDAALSEYLKDGDVSKYRQQVACDHLFDRARSTLIISIAVRESNCSIQGVQ
jgi:hypothetical protein